MMNDHILNLVTHILCYADSVVTDNPHERAIDHRRRLESIAVKNPSGDGRQLAPGEAFTMFQNSIATSLNGSSVIQIQAVSAQDSVYRLSVTSGPSGFRTARSTSGISACAVTINNASVAVFDFAGATITSLQVGDIMRIKGQSTYDTGPFAFNPINSGIWKIIGISGTKVSVVRETGEQFEGVQETVLSGAGSDVMFYADDGVRSGMMFQVSGTLSQVSQRTYEVLSSTPTTIDFVSTAAIPEESALTYVTGTIVFYSGVKKLVYVEADQECSIRLNGASDDSNRITPIAAGDKALRGFMTKIGDTYSCQVVNKSVNTCTIKFFTVE
jgi:hypothetical protein